MTGYKTDLGEYIYGDSLKLIKQIKDNSIDLIMTSPPFALQRQKAYGNVDQHVYVNWLCQFTKAAYYKLKNTGSIVLDIGGAYQKGSPIYSLYQFRFLIKMVDELGYSLAQPFYWFNSSALPAPIEWVNKRKIRAKNAVNTVWWFCKTPFCKADIRNVLTPYSSHMKKLIANPKDFVPHEGTERPSGHVIGLASWTKDNGGAIPSNLLSIPNTESNSSYLRYCRALKLKAHPARFPAKLPEFFIKMLTKENDLVVDIFAGSNTTGSVCEQLKRKWLSFDNELEYVANSVFRFCPKELDLDKAKEHYNNIINMDSIKL